MPTTRTPYRLDVQLANICNTIGNRLEQVLSILILAISAWTVMHSTEFTIGMLVAFHVFTGKLSQPMLRLVGLWQQFQQACKSLRRSIRENELYLNICSIQFRQD